MYGTMKIDNRRKEIDNDIEYLGNGISSDLFFLSYIMWVFFPLYFYIFSVFILHDFI